MLNNSTHIVLSRSTIFCCQWKCGVIRNST